MAKLSIAPGVTYLDRAGWGASSAFPRRGTIVPRNERNRVFIHHTVIIDSDPTKNLWETELEVIQRMRRLQTIRPDLGNDVPYNFVVFLMNTQSPSIYVCEGRGEDRSGAHTIGFNRSAIGIALQGDFENHPANVSDYTNLISLFLGWLKFDPNGPDIGGPFAPLSNLGAVTPGGGRLVFAHRDVTSTDCPGQAVINVLSQIKFTDPRNSNFPKIDIKIGDSIFSDSAILVDNRSFADLNLVASNFGRSIDVSIPRVTQSGTVYVRAVSLVTLGIGVSFDNPSKTLILDFSNIPTSTSDEDFQA